MSYIFRKAFLVKSFIVGIIQNCPTLKSPNVRMSLKRSPVAKKSYPKYE